MLLTFTLSAMAAGVASSSGTIINVPDDYSTIQEAIDAASAGDTVLVAPGTYVESIRMKPGVTIQGSGADVTTIQGDGSLGPSPFYDWPYTVFGASDGIITSFKIIAGPAGHWPPVGILNVGASPIITNNIITRNWIGILNFYSSPTITNNTITGNHGGIYCRSDVYHRWGSNPRITNNIITGRWCGIYRGLPPVNPTISYNDVWGNQYNYMGCSAGPGNVSVDPLFVDPAAGDYRLRMVSPCIDAGTNDAPALPGTDFDGNPRIVDGDGMGYLQLTWEHSSFR